MKKWIAFLLIFVLSLGLIACDDGEGDGDGDGDGNGDKVVAIRSIDIEGTPEGAIEVGDKFTLTAVVLPADAPQTVKWTSSDASIITIDEESGEAEALAAGSADITVVSTVNNRMTKKVTVVVEAPIVYDDPVDIIIEATRSEFRVNSNIILTASVLPETAAQDVLWTSSNEDVATVNASGRVTGKSEGAATITATVAADPTISASFDVTVVEQTSAGEDLPTEPESIVFFGGTMVEVGMDIRLLATVLPEGISQNVTWESETPDIVTVDKGKVTGVSEGTGYIKVYSNLDYSVEKVIQITVIPEYNPPARTNMEGYEVVIFAAPHVPHEHDPHLEDYTQLDKQAKIDAWAEVEELFNATMVVKGFPSTAPWGPPRINYVINNANEGTSEMDIFVSTTDWLVQFATAGATVDVSGFYAKYGRGGMNPAVMSASTYKGGMYALPTVDFAEILPYHGLFFNANKLESYNLENPAKIFNDGDWTWTRFKQYIEEASALLDEDDTVLSGKPAGLWYGMASAAGVKLIDPVNMSINFANARAVEAANIITDLYAFDDNVWGDNAWDAENPSFNNGYSLFQVGEYWFVKDSGRWKDGMWGEGNTSFGYVPFPHPDNVSKEETRVSYQGGAIYQMPTGRDYQTGVTAEDVYRMFTEMMLGTRARMKADPDVNEDLIKRSAAAAKLDDAESILAITYFTPDKVIYDPYFTVVPSWQGAGPMVDAFVVNRQDYWTVADQYNTTFQTAMEAAFG